jgi:hypothetical protein
LRPGETHGYNRTGVVITHFSSAPGGRALVPLRTWSLLAILSALLAAAAVIGPGWTRAPVPAPGKKKSGPTTNSVSIGMRVVAVRAGR